MPRIKKKNPPLLARERAREAFLAGVHTVTQQSLEDLVNWCRHQIGHHPKAASNTNRVPGVIDPPVNKLIDDLINIQLRSFRDFVEEAEKEAAEGNAEMFFDIERLLSPNARVTANVEALENLGYQFARALVSAATKYKVPYRKRIPILGQERDWRCSDLSDLFDFVCSFSRNKTYSLEPFSPRLFRDFAKRGVTATRLLVNIMVAVFKVEMGEHTIRRIVEERRDIRRLCKLKVS